MDSPVVLEVGPGVIRRRGGDGEPHAGLVAAAVDGIDDPVVLVDERPVRVDDLLRSLISQALGGWCAEVLVVHPPDWPVPRVARLLNAVRVSAGRVSATSDEPVSAAPRRRRRIQLRPRAIGITIAIVCAVAVCAGGAALLPYHRPAAPPVALTATVAEGRIAVEVPEGWTVERLTRGPGSRRVKVTSPADPDRALHITQSYAPGGTLADAAAVLGPAAAGKPEFTDFRAADLVAGRPALSYREVRPGRVVRWVVVVDGATRISIGCQSSPGAEDGIRTACDQAVRSAHEFGGTAPGR